MTREDERDMACTNWICSQENGTVIMAREVWKAAVKWADSHPHWIPVEERLPKRMREGSRFSETVLVYNKAGFIDTTYYDYEENEWKWSPSVTHWMPIVPPRKEDKE